MLEGLTKLELAKNGRVVDQIEKHNTITPYMNDLLTKGNWNWRVLPTKVTPLRQFFQGCYLTSEENDPSISMIAYNSDIVAQASSNAYSGVNTKRGSYNANESGAVANGYKFVWDWNTSQGNGDIKSVCLTRAALGASDFAVGREPEAGMFINEHLTENFGDGASAFPSFHGYIVDWEKERAYGFDYDSAVPEILIYEKRITTKILHLYGEPLVADLIETHHIPLSAAIPNYDVQHGSFSYTGDTIHWIQVHEGTTNNLIDYGISTSDWSITVHEHTYENVTFVRNFRNGVYKDSIMIKAGYFYTFALVGGLAKWVKLSMQNDADKTTFDFPTTPDGNSEYEKARNANWAGLLLPNGDICKLGSGGSKSYVFHNEKLHACLMQGHPWSDHSRTPNGNEYGTIMDFADNGCYIGAIAPFVSTVNNLGRTVSKTNDLTMKLSYTITEV